MHFKKDHQQSHNKAKHAHMYSDQEYIVYIYCIVYIVYCIYVSNQSWFESIGSTATTRRLSPYWSRSRKLMQAGLTTKAQMTNMPASSTSGANASLFCGVWRTSVHMYIYSHMKPVIKFQSELLYLSYSSQRDQYLTMALKYGTTSLLK